MHLWAYIYAHFDPNFVQINPCNRRFARVDIWPYILLALHLNWELVLLKSSSSCIRKGCFFLRIDVTWARTLDVANTARVRLRPLLILPAWNPVPCITYFRGPSFFPPIPTWPSIHFEVPYYAQRFVAISYSPVPVAKSTVCLSRHMCTWVMSYWDCCRVLSGNENGWISGSFALMGCTFPQLLDSQ